MVVLVLAWVGVVPAGGIVRDAYTADWNWHSGLLMDLAQHWPAYVRDSLFSSDEYLVRYPIGWHIVPALIGRWFGLSALNWAVPMWAWIGTSLTALLFVRGLSTLREMFAALAVLIFFSGMDLMEIVFQSGIPDTLNLLRNSLDPAWSLSPEWTGKRTLDFVTSESSPIFIEYSASTAIFINAPQHFTIAFMAPLLMIQLCRHRRFLSASGIVMACCVFWSGFVSTGLLPLAVAMHARIGLRRVASWQTLVVALPLVSLISLYFTSGQPSSPHGWLWSLYDSRLQMAADVFGAYAAEFAVLAFMLWRFDSKIARNPFFVAAIAVLAVAPWYHSHNSVKVSEWSLKFVMPGIGVLAYFASRGVVRRLTEANSISSEAIRRRNFGLGLLLVLAFGIPTALTELGLVWYRAWARGGPEPFELTVRTVHRGSSKLTIHLTRETPDALRVLLRHNNVEASRAGPRPTIELLAMHHYNVYWEDGQFIYLRQDCTPQDEAGTTFFLETYPVNVDSRPLDRQTLRYNTFRFRNLLYKKVDEGYVCIAFRGASAQEIARIRTGQLSAGGRLLWEAEADMPPTAKSAGTTR